VNAVCAITLPHGLWDGRRRESEAELRLPTGSDEAYLLSARGRSRAEQVSGLLARCVVRVGEVEGNEGLARTLTVGDREALLLHLRARVFGDDLACVLDCPACGERLDVDLRISELLVAPYREIQERHTVGFDYGGESREAIVRLVTGADQEAAALHDGPEAGLEELVARCVVEVSGPRAEAVPPLVLAEALSGPLAELDPQAESTIETVCPSCGEPLSALVDAAGILLAELTASEDRLFREVDAIARAYHWSEGEILALDVHRRRRYLELLAEPGVEAS
jgi:hypothetical protein